MGVQLIVCPEHSLSVYLYLYIWGGLSNTWNEKYSSPQKTPNWKGGIISANETPYKLSKRSRLLSDEDERQLTTRSPKRNPKTTVVPQKFNVTSTTPVKKASQKIGYRLRNLLKLPKAHKWCIYEWFYSNIDKPLFEGDNDFCVCLKESFPNLKTRKLTRVEWGKIRRLMGKPRRCSAAFFEEERSALEQKRQKIRLLQQRKVADVSQFKDLPDEIPLSLVIGTKVTARLRGVHDGLFTGQIDAVDTQNSTYRVTFDRTGLGTHTIPDYEVLSNEPHETMPIAAFGQKQRPPRMFMTPPRSSYTAIQSPVMESDTLLGQSPWKAKISSSDTETIGGFPVEFLVQVTRLSKILMIKKEHIKLLRDMNTEAEKLKSYSSPISIEFQRRYATIVLDLEQLNKDLNKVLHKVQQYCYELAPDQGLQPADQPTSMRRRCEEDARQMVRRANTSSTGQPCVQNESLTELISRLTAILLQIKCLAEGGDLNSFEFKSLTDSINDIKSTISPSNISCFQNNVEIHVAHIQSGLSQMGNLHAFAANNTNRD
uniref:Lin-9 DREAM MuvB core complex component n=1 Tax=Xenopus tropicalis TaxID=8364 RepID=F6WHF7_XENTR